MRSSACSPQAHPAIDRCDALADARPGSAGRQRLRLSDEDRIGRDPGGGDPAGDGGRTVLPSEQALQAPAQTICALPAHDADDAAAKGAMPISAGAQLLQITPRQYEVLVLLARGYPIKTVSRMLNISVATAKTHACTLYQRLHVKNKGEAVYAALQRGATLEWHEPNGREVDAGQLYGRKAG